MDVYTVGPGRGCGGLGAVYATNVWLFSRNWSKARVIQCRLLGTDPNGIVSSAEAVPSLAETIPEAELLRRVEALKGEKARDELAEGSMGPVPNGSDGAAGSLPEAWLMRRVAQIGAGKVFGSAAFVMRMAFGLGHLFPSKRVVARAVGEIGFATHGWRLANRLEKSAELAKKDNAKMAVA